MVFLRSHDAGLQLLFRRINATASQTMAKLGQAAAADYVAKLHAWVQRVMDAWAAEMVSFRRAGGVTPALEDCVNSCDHAYKFDQNLVALRFELGASSHKPQVKRSWAEAQGGTSQRLREQQTSTQKTSKASKRSKRGGQRKESARRADDDADDEEAVEEITTLTVAGTGSSGAVWADRPKFSATG
jgi:hypothetical protein